MESSSTRRQFFELYSAKLLPETRETIAQAAADAKTGTRVTIQIASNRDSISVSRYVDSLHRQAKVVERELIAHGIPAGDIETVIADSQPPPPDPGSIVIYAW